MDTPDTDAVARARLFVDRVIDECKLLGREVSVSFSVDDDLAAVIAEMPRARVRTTVYALPDGAPPHAITCARVVIAGPDGPIEIYAQHRGRPATADEIALLDTEDASDYCHAYRTVDA